MGWRAYRVRCAAIWLWREIAPTIQMDSESQPLQGTRARGNASGSGLGEPGATSFRPSSRRQYSIWGFMKQNRVIYLVPIEISGERADRNGAA